MKGQLSGAMKGGKCHLTEWLSLCWDNFFLLPLILHVHEHLESVCCIAPVFVYCELWRYIKDGFKSTYCVMGNRCSQNFVDVCRGVTEYVSMVIA